MTRVFSNTATTSVWLSYFLRPPSPSVVTPNRLPFSPFSTAHHKQKFSTLIAMDARISVSTKEVSQGLDVANEEELASQSKLLKEFASLSTIDRAWVFESDNGGSSRAMFSIGRPNLLGNKKRTHVLSSHIAKESNGSVSFQWAPFPVEMSGVSTIVPSPSGQKMLVIRNQENDSPTQFEIWGPSQVEKEIHIPKSVHGSVYTDGWFEGISWSSDETLIAYVAEDPFPSKPVFYGLGYKKTGSTEKGCNSWKGQGDFEEDWGETYSGKRRPGLFVVNIISGDVHIVDGISKSLSVGQVVWAPKNDDLDQYLVFVGWPSDCGSEKIVRKLGIKYCYNRPCALYAVKASVHKPETDKLETKGDRTEDMTAAINLTQDISSAFFPRFSPDGKFLVFLSAKSAVDTGAHSATDSLHRIDWPSDGKPRISLKLVGAVPVVKCAEENCFPGLYCSSFLRNPWLSDGQTMIMSSYWRSSQVIISVNVLSGRISRVTPNSSASWNILALDGDNILSVSSSPVELPEIKYGYSIERKEWNWLDISSPVSKCSMKVRSMLSSLQFSIMKIPVRDASVDLTDGAKTPYEAIFVSSKTRKSGACDPLIVILHGGPHSLLLTNFSKNHAFLSTLGYSLLIVNYRGSLGFGEEALQSLPGKVGSQDVNDVLAALDHVIEMGLADPSKVAVVGGSHGGFLTTHLIGQAPDRFVVAAARNPVCNLALMVGTSDIPDWCYVETYGGSEGKNYFTEAPSLDHLHVLYNKSPISHLSKVKTPTLFLLGAQDLRVPVSNGLQYARALKENGVEVKVIVFPNDIHGIDRPQSDFESFLNIGVWFNKHFQ
ncbi:acylamino-acid-releasing enzyme-like isoform X1 [Papaver somniferum]|nr:acylamino-acid-releasing enzyme-like isoform X1 [Papaver somniferum]